MSTGIYRLRIGDWFYIGQAKNFKNRWDRHAWSLKANKHRNQILQRAYNKYQTLEFDILAYCTEDKLDSIEQSLIDAYYDEDNCANLCPEVSTTRGRKHTEESKAKMSASHKGKIVSAETRARQSAVRKGKQGRPKPLNAGKASKPVEINGVLYASMGEAARQLGIKRQTLNWRLLNNRSPLGETQ